MSTDVPTYGEACAEVYDQWFGACEESAVDLLAELAGPGGAFVLEAFVPQSANFTGGLKVTAVTEDRVGLKVSEHDPVRQRLKSQHVVIRDGEVRLYPVEVRYAWPAELDLMARLAGLRLRHRWGDWNRAAIGPQSERHVSVYEKAG
jgi:hypothetical protein